jgi:hypothetical protein
MGCLKSKLIFLVILFLFFSIFPSLFSQEWSTEQKEIWGELEALYDAIATRDVDSYISMLHLDYSFWVHKEPLPHSKSSEEKWASFIFKSEKLLEYELTPVGIKIFGNVGIIQSYVKSVVEDEKGRRTVFGKYTDTLLKEDGKWLFIATHGDRGE